MGDRCAGGPLSGAARGRRAFLAAAAGALLGVALLPARALARAGRGAGDHPEPRPGIDASKVLRRDQVPEHAAEAYDRVRQVPAVVDGVRCHCGCADIPGYYSLLTCFEEGGMARHCEVCLGAGSLVWTLHREGRTLAEIRAAVDARYG